MGYHPLASISLLGLKSYCDNLMLSERCILYRTQNIEIGSNCRIDDHCILTGNIKIGDNCHIAANTIISGGRRSSVIIENNVTIAYGSIVIRSNDYLELILRMHAIEAKEIELESDTYVEDHCILGLRSSVLLCASSKRNCNCYHSLLTKSTEEWGIYVGSPARKVKERSQLFLKSLKE